VSYFTDLCLLNMVWAIFQSAQSPSNWFDSHQYIALWLEGIALLLIFAWDRWDSHQQHKQTIDQMDIMRGQARATETAANAANKSADALINSERAWVIAELAPQAVRFGDHWVRFVGKGHASLSPEEILAGHHLRYKLKLTNMGRTPAQLFGFTIRYSCLAEGVRDLPENAGGKQASSRPFEHLLGGNGEVVEIGEPIVDVGQYIGDDLDAIKRLEKTAVIHGEVKYRHMFSTDDCYAAFCYVYTVSEERLSSVGRHTKQRQEKAN
jgi:hypothetical protein